MSDEASEESAEELETAGFVTCAACGARMRANRLRCLRCDEIFVAAPTPITWNSLKSGRPLAIAVGSAVAVIALVVIVWVNRPVIEEEAAQPYNAPGAPAPVADPAAAVAPRDVNTPSPATSDTPASREVLDDQRAGSASFAAGNLEDAKAALQRALEKNPNDADALNNLGQVLSKLGDSAGAIVKFERAIQLVPGNWSYHFNLAHAVSEQGNDRVAVPEFQKAIHLAPAEASLHIGLATSLEKLGQMADAEREFQQYLAMDPNGADAANVRTHLALLRP